MSYQPDPARDTLLSGSTNKNVHLSNMSNRVNSQNRIISPTSSCNNYPHLRAENSVFNSKKSGYGIIPESYGGNNQAGPHTRQDPVIKKKPATFKSILGSQNSSPHRDIAYGTNDANGEPISVKGHLHDLEVCSP